MITVDNNAVRIDGDKIWQIVNVKEIVFLRQCKDGKYRPLKFEEENAVIELCRQLKLPGFIDKEVV